MSFSFLTVPSVSGGWGCSSQINELSGGSPSPPAETTTPGEYRGVWASVPRASVPRVSMPRVSVPRLRQPENGQQTHIWALLLSWLPSVNDDCQANTKRSRKQQMAAMMISAQEK